MQPNTSPNPRDLPTLGVTTLAQYVKHQNCDRFLRFRVRPDEEEAMRNKWSVTIQPLTPLLREEGDKFEQHVIEQLRSNGEPVVELDTNAGIADTAAWLLSDELPVLLTQPTLGAEMGRYWINGRADVIRLTRDGDIVHAFIADIKASRKERMEHRLQVAAYAYMLKELAAQVGVPLTVQAGIITLSDDGLVPPLDGSVSFDLEPYLTTLHHIAIDADCILNRVADASLADISYQLTYRCDGCLYNSLCMLDSAERQDIALVPNISANERRALRAAGVDTVTELASLMELPQPGGYELSAASGKEELVAQLAGTWPLGNTLPILVQRARRLAAGRFKAAVESKGFLYNSGWSALPDRAVYPDLIQVFLEGHYDYLRDRVYMLAAHIVGPQGDLSIVRMADGPPDHDAERDLLTAWVSDLLASLDLVAAGQEAPIHLYCFSPYDQRKLLDALKRHLDAVGALPGFFDLMTQNPALEQSIISFLAQEVEQRQNLDMTCLNLHDVARRYGFDWSAGGRDFFSLFRTRLWDNRRDFVRAWNGALQPVPSDVPRGDPRRITVESAARFNSQIPLEYAYAVWDALPGSHDAQERSLLAQFRRVHRADLEAFAVRRVEALAHIERSLKSKSREDEKPALDIAALRTPTAVAPTLAQSMREFLFIEHHTALQERLQAYALPIAQRVQTGAAFLLRYGGAQLAPNRYEFPIEFDLLDLDPTLTLNAFRLKEGAWVVLNPADEQLSAKQIKHGQLAVIQEVRPHSLVLEFVNIGGAQQQFRFFHKTNTQPQADRLYTLDEMADDMTGDKVLAALGAVEHNTFYSWLLSPPASRPVESADKELAERILANVNEMTKPYTLTDKQAQVVAGELHRPLLLVQGPPGTGKSQTIGWAVLDRILLADAGGRPLRVGVACRTHNAVNIVLDSVADKLARWTNAGHDAPPVSVLKLVNDIGDDVPNLVGALDTYKTNGQKLDQLLATPYVVIGGTPGGLYNLAKRRATGGKAVDWKAQPFDLLVIDEASQMSLPEGVLAGAFLQSEGAMLVVGDHRQMPPIVAHDWDNEEKRSTVAERPFVSLFESLLERGFPSVALDRSFRLHEILARFLQENIYRHDGIDFHSLRRDGLDALPQDAHDLAEFVEIALDPAYPIVVVEHAEQSSHQHNLVEAAIVKPLIDACTTLLGLAGKDGVGVVVPHRAQRSLLREAFPALADAQAIDTVERFQGGERDVIIVSATASDPDYVLAEADFLLNLNRLNVALSRPRKKLIVVASRSVTNLLVSDLEVFDQAVLWKRLYYQYAERVLWEGQVAGVAVRVRGMPGTVSVSTNGASKAAVDSAPLRRELPIIENVNVGNGEMQSAAEPVRLNGSNDHEVRVLSAPFVAPPVAQATDLTLDMLWAEAGFTPNYEQRRAIQHTSGPLYLPAGPGSGKTRVLLWRTLNLIVFQNTQPEDIFLATFTEKAALQLREGLEVLLGMVTNLNGVQYDLTRMYVGTVHSLCGRLLNDRRFAADRTRMRPPRLLDDLGQYFQVQRKGNWQALAAAAGLEPEEAVQTVNTFFSANSQSRHVAAANAIAFFNRMAEECLSPAELLARLEAGDAELAASVQTQQIDPEGLRVLLRMNVAYLANLNGSAVQTTDFSLIQQAALDCVRRLPDGGAVFKHVIVDEYQDTNTIQERLFFALAAGTGNLCVVGDDDQALYRFRGATVENFVQFPRRCKEHLDIEPTQIPLVTNYRSRRQIVHFYTDFMKRHDWRQPDGAGYYRVVDKDIRAHSHDDGPAVVASTPAAPTEACSEIAQLVRRLIDEGRVADPNQIAFLYPSLQYQGKMNLQVERMKRALEDVGIEVYAPRAGRFLDVPEARLVFGLLACIFGQPVRSAAVGGYKEFLDWLQQVQGDAQALIDSDRTLMSYVEQRRNELAEAVSDWELLQDELTRRRWTPTSAYDPARMKRALVELPGISAKARRSLGSAAFDRVVAARAAEGRSFTLEYVLRRATSLDYTALDLFYELCGFAPFTRMFDLAEKGIDEGPICNLGLVSQYLARFTEQFATILTAPLLADRGMARLFFGLYVYALYRRGESEFENADDPFPRGRVPFLTIHQSKGLEFPVVVLGNPRKNNRGPQAMERIVRPFLQRAGAEPLDRLAGFDIMRMFYVALSRAKNLLILAHYEGRGQQTSEPFKTMFADGIMRIPDLDLATVPTAKLDAEELPHRYSYTLDFLGYRKCPRQYMIFSKYGLAPSRSATMFFGSLVHQTLEDLHNHLIAQRSAQKEAAE